MSGQKKYHDNRYLPLSHRRSKFGDYKGRGIYLITLCTEGREPLLGTLHGNTADEAYIAPTPLGREVLRLWENIPRFQKQAAEEKSLRTGQECRREIKLLATQLMPDHLHGVVFVEREMDIALGRIIGGFMMSCTKAFNAAVLPSAIPPLGNTRIFPCELLYLSLQNYLTKTSVRWQTPPMRLYMP